MSSRTFGCAPREDLDDVADRRAVERGDDADAVGERGKRTLARLLEQAFCLQLLLELLEGQLQRAEAMGLQVVAEELILALGLVDREPAARDDVLAILGLERQVAHRRSVHHRPDLRAPVLEREVEMPGVPPLAVRDLAFDPEIAEARFEHRADRRRELRDRDHAPLARPVIDRLIVFERSRKEIRHVRASRKCRCRAGALPAVCARAASASTSSADRFSRSMAVARPVFGSAVTMTALRRPGPLAASNLAGMPFRNRPSAASTVTPMIESCGPVMPDVGEARRALRQQPLVRRLHVRMGADDRGHAPVEMPAHRDLLRRRLGVEVDEDDARLRAHRLDFAQRDRRTDRRAAA